MKRFRAEVAPEERFEIRGGVGRAGLSPYVMPREMAGVEFVSLVTLDPEASIGEHHHPSEEELYLVLEGGAKPSSTGNASPLAPATPSCARRATPTGFATPARNPLPFWPSS